MLAVGRPIAVVDLDDTIGDLCNLLVASLNYHTAQYREKHEFTDFFAMDSMYGISYEKFVSTIIEDELLSLCAPLPGARAAMERLVEDHHVVVVTAREYHPNAYKVTDAWLRMHKIPCHRVIVPSKGQNKVQAVEEVFGKEPRVVFDDGLHNLNIMGQHWKNAILMAPAQPWNVAGHLDDRILRVHSFRVAVSAYYADFVEGR